MIQETRICRKCFKEKPLDSFRWLNTQGRYQSQCKECEREYMRKYNKSISADKRAEYTITHRLTHISATKVLKLLTKQKDIYMNQLETLQSNIEQWAVDRNLHTGDPNRQVLKLLEEQGELAGAIARDKRNKMIDGIGDVTVTTVVMAKQLNIPIDVWKIFEKYMESGQEKPDEPFAVMALAGSVASLANAIYCEQAESAIYNAITQVVFRIIHMATSLNIDFIEAVQSAYDEIKDRKGTLVNGVFIKEGE